MTKESSMTLAQEIDQMLGRASKVINKSPAFEDMWHLLMRCKAALSRCERDAERYKWLRPYLVLTDCGEYSELELIGVPDLPHGQPDAAIDAAIAFSASENEK